MLFIGNRSVSALFIGAFLLCCMCISTAYAASTPAFWKVESKTATVYLMGSMHFGHTDFYPMPQVIDRAFVGADKLVVELDITKIEPMAAMKAVMQFGRLEPGKTLQTELSPETMVLLKAYSEKNKLPLPALQNFKPWFVALQLVEAELRKTDFKPDLGVDSYFLSRAKGKKVVALETLEGQLGLFSALTMEQQESFLRQTLKDMSQSQAYLNALAKYWKAGDLKALEASLLEPFKHSPEAKALYKAVFTDRNHSMAQSVVEYLKGNDEVFFVVGSGHMVGDDGVVSLLRKAGYKPKPLSP